MICPARPGQENEWSCVWKKMDLLVDLHKCPLIEQEEDGSRPRVRKNRLRWRRRRRRRRRERERRHRKAKGRRSRSGNRRPNRWVETYVEWTEVTLRTEERRCGSAQKSGRDFTVSFTTSCFCVPIEFWQREDFWWEGRKGGKDGGKFRPWRRWVSDALKVS